MEAGIMQLLPLLLARLLLVPLLSAVLGLLLLLLLLLLGVPVACSKSRVDWTEAQSLGWHRQGLHWVQSGPGRLELPLKLGLTACRYSCQCCLCRCCTACASPRVQHACLPDQSRLAAATEVCCVCTHHTRCRLTLTQWQRQGRRTWAAVLSRLLYDGRRVRPPSPERHVWELFHLRSRLLSRLHHQCLV